MKTFYFCMALIAFLFSTQTAQAQIISPQSKVLVAYYSRSGNTAEIARQIQTATGADVFEIIPAEPYPEDYRQTTEQARKEIAEGYLPALKNQIDNLEQYDVIFIGSPCWWGTIASPVSSFLSAYDFSGKTVIPFMTHGGSGLGHGVEDIRKLIPSAEVADGRAFLGTGASLAAIDVNNWIKGMKND